MQNTTEIKVKVFDDGKEPVTCIRGSDSCRFLDTELSFFDVFCCDAFNRSLVLGVDKSITPCPECLAAREVEAL